MSRQFAITPAVREKTPILVGLVGPSGSGKTYSALRLATGFQRVVGGKIVGIDTEARRMLHYADRFKFEHMPFGAPFSPLDYLDAMEHAVRSGATTVIVDSMSHEHEGPGGVLEMHQAEFERLGSREATKMLAWNKPKQARRRLINGILQMPCNFIFCFRAKEKLKIAKGQEPEKLGFMPIGGEEFIYEMTLKCLLLPGAMGVPTWRSDFMGERAMMKLPEQFRELFSSAPQLTEEIGQALATWGAAAPQPSYAPALVDLYERCSDATTMAQLEERRRASWSTYSKADKALVKAASEAASRRISPETEAEEFIEAMLALRDELAGVAGVGKDEAEKRMSHLMHDQPNAEGRKVAFDAARSLIEVARGSV